MSHHLSAGSAGFGTDRLRLPIGDEDRCERKPNLSGLSCPRTEHMVWPVKTAVLIQGGLESKKNFSRGGIFSLDFPFYRTIFELFC
jgi:hypothetical protein